MDQESSTDRCRDVNPDRRLNSSNENLTCWARVDKNQGDFPANRKEDFNFSSSLRGSRTSKPKNVIEREIICGQIGDVICPKLKNLRTPSNLQRKIGKTSSGDESSHREHDELEIQRLQKIIMEHRKKLYVAIRIDNGKNLALSRIQASLNDLEQKLRDVQLQNSGLKKSLQNNVNEHNVSISNCLEQIKKFQKEHNEAMVLASEYKNKIDLLARDKLEFSRFCGSRMSRFKKSVTIFTNLLERTREDCCKLIQETRRENEEAIFREEELRKERLKIQELEVELDEKRNSLSLMEAEVRVLRKDRETLRLRLKDEVDKNRALNYERLALIEELDERKLVEEKSKSEIKVLTAEKGKLKCKLDEFYQKQMKEQLKLKFEELQSQLETAKTWFQGRLQQKRIIISKSAAKKIRSSQNKHKLEIQLLEEKFKEENRLHDVNLSEVNKKLALLDSRISGQKINKDLIVSQLHLIMKNQWQQVMRLVSGENLCTEVYFHANGDEKQLKNKQSEQPINLQNNDSNSCVGDSFVVSETLTGN